MGTPGDRGPGPTSIRHDQLVTKFPGQEFIIDERDEQAQHGGWVPEPVEWTWWQRMWEPFWAIPVALALGATVLGLALPALDERVWPWVPMLFHGGPAGARSVLSTITTAMISVTGLVFSITMVVLQLASSQFTPRVLGTFLDSRVTQSTLGVFTGTFLYALTVLRAVRDPARGDDGFVPQLATSTAYLFVLASVGLFLAFIHHITTSIQVSRVVRRTAAATLETLDRMLPEDQEETATRGEPPRWHPPVDGTSSPVEAGTSDAWLTDINYRELVDIACTHDVVVTIEGQVGDHVAGPRVLGQVWGPPEAAKEAAEKASGLLHLGPERELRQDVAFGIRQVVDIAERALSPGVNDPTTAVEAINALHTVLVRMVVRRVPSAHVTDDEGRVRLVYRPQTVEQHLDLAIREIAYWGRDSIQVPRRLREVLADLEQRALPQYLPALARLRHWVDEQEGQES